VDRVDAVERIGTLPAVPSTQLESIEAASTVGWKAKQSHSLGSCSFDIFQR
jgi:hypothetical protein